MKNEEKIHGRFYTPEYIVSNILDLSNYNGSNILKKHVIDNSCGQGAFLIEIVKRYCEAAKENNVSDNELKKDLETFIHGIELDKIEKNKCVAFLDNLCKTFNIFNVKWDIIQGNTLNINKYNGKMDFVLGNPPYVRVHNLNNDFEAVKNYSFASQGMTDLFIVFYQIGLNMLNKNGILGYITPSSLFNSIASSKLRKELVLNNYIDAVVDLQHFQAFEVTTYTTILILNNNKKNTNVKFYNYDENKRSPKFIEKLEYNDFYINDNFYFADKKKLSLLKNIFTNNQHSNVNVKNGYATLCDGVFVNNFNFNSKHIIKAIKCSTGDIKNMFYPYDKNGKIIDEQELKKDKKVYNYLLENKDKLLNRSTEKNATWYAFGRSQGINDTYKNKISINTLVRNASDVKINIIPSGVGMYSGLYIISDKDDLDEVKNVLQSDEFVQYVSLLGKYKSGGYYTFSSKDIKAYLDYKLSS